MYRGRFPLGEEITIGLQCKDGGGRPAVPDACPQVDVYGPAGKVLSGKGVPVMDRFGAKGLFAYNLFLGPTFAPGVHTAIYRWTTGAGAFKGMEQDVFEIAAGGDPKGTVLAMYWYERPQASYIVQQLDSGRVVANRNPYL